MKLKPLGMIPTRWHVEMLAKSCEETVTDIDLSEADVIGGSTMHQFLVSFPNAAFTGLTGWNKQEYDWVIESINSDEFKRNQGGKQS